jgi:hypothetical protein
LDVELDEGAGQLLLLPGRGLFARAEPHDHVLPAHRLAGLQGDVLDDAVALVEDAEDGNPLGHGCHPTLPCRRDRHALVHRRHGILLLRALAARGERKRDQ